MDPNEIHVDDDALSDEDVRVRMESEGTTDTKTRAHGRSTNNQDMNNKNSHRSRRKIRSPLDQQVDVPLAGANDASLKAALTQLSATILDGGSKDGSAVPHHTSRAHHPLPPLGDPHGVGLFRVVLTRDSCRPAREWVHAGVVVDKPWATVKPIAVHVAHTEGFEIRVDVVEEEEEEVETGVKKKTTTKKGTEVLHRVILVDDSEMKVLPTERQQLLLLPELTAQDMDDACDVRAGEWDGDERLPSDTVLEVIVDAFCQELEKTAEVTVTQNTRTTTKGRGRGHGRSPKKKSTTTGAPRLVDVLPDVQREVWERERVRLEALAARKLVMDTAANSARNLPLGTTLTPLTVCEDVNTDLAVVMPVSMDHPSSRRASLRSYYFPEALPFQLHSPDPVDHPSARDPVVTSPQTRTATPAKRKRGPSNSTSTSSSSVVLLTGGDDDEEEVDMVGGLSRKKQKSLAHLDDGMDLNLTHGHDDDDESRGERECDSSPPTPPGPRPSTRERDGDLDLADVPESEVWAYRSCRPSRYGQHLRDAFGPTGPYHLLRTPHLQSCLPSRLHREIQNFADALLPTPWEEAVLSAGVRLVHEVVVSLWGKTVTVNMFGSQASGLALPGSDVDLVIGGLGTDAGRPSRQGQRGNVPLLEHFLHTCRRRKIVANAQVIRARVPIVKCRLVVPLDSHLRRLAPPTRQASVAIHLDADICIGVTDGIRTARLIRTYLERVPVARPLILVVKELLRHAGLDKVFYGGLGAFSTTVLVLAHLTQLGHGPSSNIIDVTTTTTMITMYGASRSGGGSGTSYPVSHDLGALLHSFLDHLSRCELSQYAASIRQGGWVPKKDVAEAYEPLEGRHERAHNGPRLCVEDPTHEGADIARGTFEIRRVRDMFRNAARKWMAAATTPEVVPGTRHDGDAENGNHVTIGLGYHTGAGAAAVLATNNEGQNHRGSKTWEALGAVLDVAGVMRRGWGGVRRGIDHANPPNLPHADVDVGGRSPHGVKAGVKLGPIRESQGRDVRRQVEQRKRGDGLGRNRVESLVDEKKKRLKKVVPGRSWSRSRSSKVKKPKIKHVKRKGGPVLGTAVGGKHHQSAHTMSGVRRD